MVFLACFGQWWFFSYCLEAQTVPTLSDQPAPEARHPSFIHPNQIQPERFSTLKAESLAGRLKLASKPSVSTNAAVTAFVSIEEPGHWLARDWRPHPMDRSGEQWDVAVPFRNLDQPVYYFLQTIDLSRTNYSQIRVCHPRELGLENITSVFFPFIEGFEIGSMGWKLLEDDHFSDSVRLEQAPKNGHFSLGLKIPANKRSTTVGTLRVRGSEIVLHRMMGLRFWIKSSSGNARIRSTLFANAFTTNQVVSVFPGEMTATETWQKVEMAFQRFPKLPLSEVDFFTMEIIATGPREFWIDDLEYLGLGNLD